MLDWQYILPTSSVCLRVPVVPPSAQERLEELEPALDIDHERGRRRAALANTVSSGHP